MASIISYFTVINFLLVSRNGSENVKHYLTHHRVNTGALKSSPGGEGSHLGRSPQRRHQSCGWVRQRCEIPLYVTKGRGKMSEPKKGFRTETRKMRKGVFLIALIQILETILNLTVQVTGTDRFTRKSSQKCDAHCPCSSLLLHFPFALFDAKYATPFILGYGGEDEGAI